MIAVVVVMLNEGLDVGFEITWQEVVFQKNAVLQGLVPTLNLTLGLWMIWRSTDVIHVLVIEPNSQITRDVRCAVVGQQSRPVNDVDLVTA